MEHWDYEDILDIGIVENPTNCKHHQTDLVTTAAIDMTARVGHHVMTIVVR